MPLTVSQALQEFPVLAKARVVAGSKSLDRNIRWTHIIDHPDVIPWVQEGHLLLTTAFSLMLHPDEQTGLIQSLDDKHLAGMMINIGRYMLEIPAEMIAAAEAVDFPLITIPWEVDFVEVTHALHEHIIRERYALAEQANRIHKNLTQIVLEGGDLEGLARTLADILHCSVTIEDDDLQLLAHATIEPTDEVRSRSILEGRTPHEAVVYLRQQGIFDHLQKNPAPYHIAPHPQIGMTLERIVAPILVGSQLYGYIWIIAGDQPLTELDQLVIERGAVVAALILSREEAVYETEQRIKAQFLEGSSDSGSPFLSGNLPDMAWPSGMKEGFIVLVLEASNPDRRGMRQLATFVEAFMQEEGIWAMTIERGQRLVVVPGTTDLEKLQALADRLVQAAAGKGFQLLIGMSSPAERVDLLRQRYQQALDTLVAASALQHGDRQVWLYDDLGFLSQLLPRSSGERVANRFTAILNSIEQYDRQKRTSHLLTLETYLDHLTSPNQAAKKLYIHRNTLYQRLARIANQWRLDFQDPLVVLNLSLAIKEWRLNEPQ